MTSQCKWPITRARLRGQDFATGKNFSFNQCHTKSFTFFSRENYFIKAIQNFFPVFAQPDINTRGVGRILDGYANPRLRLRFAKLSRILPTPLVFISGYANTENVFYCLNIPLHFRDILLIALGSRGDRRRGTHSRFKKNDNFQFTLQGFFGQTQLNNYLQEICFVPLILALSRGCTFWSYPKRVFASDQLVHVG